MSDDLVRVRIKGSRPARPVVASGQTGGRAELPADGVVLRSATFVDVDFSRLRLDNLGIDGCVFERCDFTKAILRGSIGLRTRTVFRDCTFDRADLRRASPGQTRYERCSFEGTRLDGWRTWDAEFVACRFAGRLHDVEFDGRAPIVRISSPGAEPEPMAPNEFRDNDFRAAELDDVEFRGGIDLDAQRWPDDPLLRRLDVSPKRLDQAEAAVRRGTGDQLERDLDLLRWIRGRYRDQPLVLVRTLRPATFGRYLEILALADAGRARGPN
jgi:hypothetical protein